MRRTSELFDPSTYDSSNIRKYRTDNWLYQKHIEQFQQCLYELVTRSDPDSLLDAGCGEGFMLDYLNRQKPSFSLTGIDKDPKAIAYARSLLQTDARFQTGNLYNLPFPDTSFDTVVCSEVLEHLDHPERAVQELKRVSRQHVLITVPREPYFQWLNELGQRLGLCPDPGHVQFWDHEAFKAFVHRHFRKPVFRTKHIYQLVLAKV